jgi:predicted transcriptional regulator of viral defense system
MSILSSLKRISEITAYQWGMFTTAQAELQDVSRNDISRLAAHGYAERLVHGVYRITSVPSDEFEELKAIWLSFIPAKLAYERMKSLHDDYIVSGVTAASLHQMADYRSDQYVFTHPGRKQSRNRIIRFMNRSIDELAVVIVNGLPVTSKEQTYKDLIAANEDISSVTMIGPREP